MVSRAIRSLLLAAIAFISASSLPAKDYQIGEKAEADISTPVPLVVVDPDATEALKEKEGQRIPTVFRFYPNAINEVEAAFHATFVRTHSNFLDAVEARFSQRTLGADVATSSEFQKLAGQFQKQNILFPVGPNLSRIWAKGESDQEIESALIAKLRETMKGYVRAENSSNGVWVGSTIRIVSLADNETATAEVVKERGFNIPKTNFTSLPKAKSALQSGFPAEERSVAKYLASFIKPNCTMEADLTLELRAERTASMLAADNYAAGQIIVKRGQTINQKTKAALDMLTEKTAVSQLQKVEAIAKPEAAAPDSRTLIWIVGGGIVGALILLVAVWKLAGHRAAASLLPVHVPGGALQTAAPVENEDAEAWRQRALLAEQRVQKAQAVVRAGVMGQLAQWMSDKMTQKLVSQRMQLLDAHQKAAMEMAELEARLEKVHAPLQQRLVAYESRIAHLEKELSIKGEENRELIKAKIQLVRKQLEIEREKNRMEFN